MNILTLESSSLSASVCITEDTKLLAQSFQNCGLTHSATLLPMIDHIMTSAQMTLADIDVIACVTGPGSFTGVRIGVSTAKGIADAKNIPCVGVSSLAGAAWNVAPLTDRLICPVMDARRGQLYNALFDYTGGALHRLTPDRAISLEDLAAEKMKENKIFTSSEENLDIRYGKLKTDHEGLTKQYTEAQTLIEELKKSSKGNEGLQTKLAEYEAKITELQKELADEKLASAIKVGLLSEKATDIDYLTFKLKESGELELDDKEQIKGWSDKVDDLKKRFPNQFESASKNKIVPNKLNDGKHDDSIEPKNLAEALKNQYEPNN